VCVQVHNRRTLQRCSCTSSPCVQLPTHPPGHTTTNLTFAVAPLMRSSRVSSLRSWWWLPLPLLMISTPASARLMWGACEVG
jgi:hypothetical protein